MKKLIKITLALLLTNVTFGQELPQLTLTQNGVEPIVVDVKEKTAQELYQKALNWVWGMITVSVPVISFFWVIRQAPSKDVF